MSEGCCGGCSGEMKAESGAQRNALTTVLLINAIMFGAELGAGLWAHSSALQADSIDMLIDAVGLGVSLFALNRTTLAHARAGFMNATLELVLAVGILFQLCHQIITGAEPLGWAMMAVGGVALTANVANGLLVMRYRHHDVNMRAIWLCTRNDAVGNAATLAAGACVLAVGVGWPDWIVGALIAMLFIRTSLGLLRETWGEMRQPASM